ncbi:hypothetical protein AB1L30_20465 [Bremerella sp. JC817]|uniref:hypothetical protein n=1 Tax=Bremerella sp. JC817 TaxID=3231756 RepID=UPI0034591D84
MFRLAALVALILVTLTVGCDVDPIQFRRTSPDLYYQNNPVGEDYFREHGTYPRQYTASFRHLNAGGVRLPNPLQKVEQLSIHQMPGDDEYLLTHYLGREFDGDDLRYAEEGRRVTIKNGDWFPYYGHVFEVHIKGNHSINMVDRTTDLSSDWRPSEDCRTLVLGEVAELFGNEEFFRQPQQPMETTREQITLLSIAADGSEAQIGRCTQTLRRDERSIRQSEDGPTTELTIRPGDQLDILGHQVRIKQIVPSAAADSDVKVVGWIELEKVGGTSAPLSHQARTP